MPFITDWKSCTAFAKQLNLTFGFGLMVGTLGQPSGYIGKTLLIPA